MNPKLLRYYKKKMYGGRSLFARATDFIIFRVFLLFIIFLIVLYYSLSTTVALLISVFLTAAISLAIMARNRKKVEKYIIDDMLRIKQKCQLEKLTFMENEDYAAYIYKLFEGNISDISLTEDGFRGRYKEHIFYALHNHPKSECGVSDVLKIYRSSTGEKLIILSLSEFSKDAQAMCLSLPEKVEIIGGKKVLEIASKMGMLPDDSEAEEDAIKEMNESIITLEKLKESAFSKTKIKSYVICGIVIMCWPLVTGFRIYYPIIAIICFALAIITYRKSKQHGESSDASIS